MKTKEKNSNKETKNNKAKADSIPRDEIDICAEIMSHYDYARQKEYELYLLREKKRNKEKNRKLNR